MTCKHPRVGIVSNQQFGPADPKRAHHMRAVCDRPECIAAAIKACNRFTKEKDTATFVADVDHWHADFYLAAVNHAPDADQRAARLRWFGFDPADPDTFQRGRAAVKALQKAGAL